MAALENLKKTKKTKAKENKRYFQKRWTLDHFFTENPDGRPLCLVCKEIVSVIKEHTLNNTMRLLRSESPSGMCAKLHTVAEATIEIMCRNHSIIACSWDINGCCSSRTSRSWWITHTTPTNGEVATTSLPCHNEPHRSHVLFVKAAPGTTFTSWSQHHFCCMSHCLALQTCELNRWIWFNSFLRKSESVIQAHGCWRHEADRGFERWHCTIYCPRLLRRG